jgi:uncharacterized phiE125 gp8 family phage protein
VADAQEPLTLDQAKANLRVDANDEDTLIGDLIVSAREHIENVTGLVLVPRALTETAPTLGRWIDLRSWPVQEVTAVRYPALGVMTALADGAWLYSKKARPVRLVPATWGWGVGAAALMRCGPGLAVEIDVTAGYQSPDEVPATVKRAMQLLIAHWYVNRPAVLSGDRAAAVELPLGVADLLRSLKRKVI